MRPRHLRVAAPLLALALAPWLAACATTGAVVEPAPPGPALEQEWLEVLEGGELVRVPVLISPDQADTLAAREPAVPFALAFPATLAAGYARDAEWYLEDEPLEFEGARFVKVGEPELIREGLVRIGERGTVPLFTEADGPTHPHVIFVPVLPGVYFQPYVMPVTARNGGPSLPQFRPWPPPRPSDRYPIPRTHFMRAGTATRYADVAERLRRAFDAAGYGQVDHYAVPGGFALVARLEQINPDGRPMSAPARWDQTVRPPEMFSSLDNFLNALLSATQGYYRVVVFTVTDQLFATPGPGITSEEADAWIGGGFEDLPPALAATPFTNAHHVNALIYEFRKATPTSEAVQTGPRLNARTHLERAGLWREIVR